MRLSSDLPPHLNYFNNLLYYKYIWGANNEIDSVQDNFKMFITKVIVLWKLLFRLIYYKNKKEFFNIKSNSLNKIDQMY